MKRLFSILSVLILIIIIITLIFVRNHNTETIQADGVVMSINDFRDTLTGEPSSRIPMSEAKSMEKASISLSDIAMHPDTIEFTAALTVNNTTTTLPVKGKFAAGAKTQHGINSMIIEVPDTVNGYNFLLFEVCDGFDKNDLLVAHLNDTQTLSTNDPYMKIYIQYQNSNIYLFEAEMPDIFSNFDAAQFPAAYKYKDAILWADHLAKGETKELVTTNDILQKFDLNPQTKELNTCSIWINPTTYYHTYSDGGVYTQCWSMPYVEYQHVNVCSQDSTWIASFKIAEHTVAAGNVYYDHNVFEYRNLQIAFGCGDKTTFVRTLQEGRMKETSLLFPSIAEIGSRIKVHLLTKAVSTLPCDSTFQTVLNNINSMTSTTGNVILGSTGTIFNRKTVSVAEKLDKYAFSECTNHDGQINNGHYFTYQGVLQYDSANGNTDTVGVLSFSFDRYFPANDTFLPISNNIQLNYSSQP